MHIYHKKANRLSALTSDHILNVGYGKTKITRWTKGTRFSEDIPVKVIELTRNDNVFYYTDGFYNIAGSMLSNKSITEIKKSIINPNDDVSLIQVNL